MKHVNASADVLGCSAIVLLVFLWLVVPDPFKLHLGFPGRMRGIAIALLWVIVAPLLAGVWGRKIWFVVLALSVITFVYVGFVYQSPLWY